MKRSPDLTESASDDKLHCQKEEEFLTCWATPYPRGVNENKVNAFSSYYPRWKMGLQLWQEAERHEIKTASDMLAGTQYEIALPNKSVRLALW